MADEEKTDAGPPDDMEWDGEKWVPKAAQQEEAAPEETSESAKPQIAAASSFPGVVDSEETSANATPQLAAAASFPDAGTAQAATPQLAAAASFPSPPAQEGAMLRSATAPPPARDLQAPGETQESATFAKAATYSEAVSTGEPLLGTTVLDAEVRAPAATVAASLLEALDDEADGRASRFASAVGIVEKTGWAEWRKSSDSASTKERTITYKAKSPIGVTRVTCEATAQDVGRSGAVLFVERSRALDVPNGDKFVTVVRKLVSPSESNDGSCTLKVTVEVEAASSFVTLGMVRSGATAETKARMRKLLAVLKRDVGDVESEAGSSSDVEAATGAPGGMSESSMDEQCMRYAAPDPGFFEKGNVSNIVTFVVLIVGVILRVAVVGEDKYPDSLYARCVLGFGLFGFAGGVTNLLAVRMLFDKIPGVYGSGIIPNQFQSIKVAIRTMILDTFFEEDFLSRQVKEKINILHDSSTVSGALDKAMAIPQFGVALEDKLSMLMTTPIGAMIVAVGATPASLVPIVKPVIRQVGLEVAPRVAKSLSNQALPLDKFRGSVSVLIDERLAELTANRVRMLVEAVMKANLGWLVVWGNVFGGAIGLVSEIAFYYDTR
ncbi:VASt domain-containing protein [Pseudoscourfieldia marina]